MHEAPYNDGIKLNTTYVIIPPTYIYDEKLCFLFTKAKCFPFKSKTRESKTQLV